MADGNYSKNFFLAVLFALAVLTILVVKPFLVPLASAGIIAYLFFPVHRYIHEKTHSKRFAAWIVVILLFLIITMSMYFVVNALTREGYTLFITVKQKLSAEALIETDCAATPSTFCELNNQIIRFFKDPQIKFYLQDSISKVSNYITDQTFKVISNLPGVALDLIVMFFVIYYLLVDGAAFIDKVKKSIPLKSHHVDNIIEQFDSFTFATLYGKLIVALIQGVIGGITFFALGLTAPLIAGIAMAFFAFLPVIGTPIIWLPAAITLILVGETGKGVALLLVGTFIIASIDNILKPAIIGKRTKLHPAAVLVGIFGGIFLIGPVGIVVGPLIISLLISFIGVYYKEGY